MLKDGREQNFLRTFLASNRYRAILAITALSLTTFVLSTLNSRKSIGNVVDEVIPAHLCQYPKEEKGTAEKILTEVEEPHYELPSPFYLHYIRFLPDSGEKKLRFIDYLSVMSGVQYLQPDGVLVHGDFEPEGEYWDKLKSHGLVRHVPRNKTTNAGQRLGKPKVVGFIEHAADMARLDVLLEYGGVTADFDIFFVRGERVREILTTKKAILCYGDIDGYNIGFVAAHKNSAMLYAWRRSYRDIYVNDWNFNQAFVSKFLAVIYHDEVYVADKMCNNPHPDRNLGSYFHDHGKIEYKNSIAIHSYERFGGVAINTPADLEGKLTTHKELLRMIYGNLTRKPVDADYHDKIDPLTSELE